VTAPDAFARGKAPVGDAIEVHAERSLIFRAGGRVYCCDIEAVREVVTPGMITRLPSAPPYVPGIINVRGVIVTVIDAGMYMHGRPCTGPGSVMLVDAGARAIGFLVDTVADVRVVRADEGYHTLDVRAAVARVIALTEDE